MMKMKSVRVSVILMILVLELNEGCWKEEREALVGLHPEFHAKISAQADWAEDCCKWRGVECNHFTRRVVMLDLSYAWDNVYRSPLLLNYSHFLAFKQLHTLHLQFNNIAACLGNKGWMLNSLEVLDLGGNNLDSTDSILSCVDGFSSLKSLKMNFNWFDATSSHAFQTLSSKLLNLEVLDLSYNPGLTNNILPYLRGFTSLKELYLSATRLDSELLVQVLETSSKLLDLEVLDLSYTPGLTNNILSSLRRFTSLKELYLAGAGLDSELLVEGSSSLLTNLEVLDMSNNNFSEADIGSSLSGLPSLKSLTLRDCRLTSRSLRSISKLRTLEILDISNNRLNDSILWSLEEEEFSWPTNLQFLGLKLNSFSNEILSSLSGLQYLSSLYLGDNRLEGALNISGISALRNLEIVDFSYNNISGFAIHQDWSGLKALKEFNMIHNIIEGPLPSFFANLSSLQTLNLCYNYFIGNIGPHLASITSLEHLDFHYNQFEVPISLAPFANHSNLKFIDGSGNKVVLDSQYSSLETLVPKFQLEVLDLSSSLVSKTNSLPLPNFLLYQYNLVVLDCSGCRLRGDFPNWLLENNTKMSHLYLMNCAFTGTFRLPSRPLLNLTEIDLSDNSITGQIPNNNITSIFPNLGYLNMSTNEIHGSIPPEFGQMKLTFLDLSNNHLSGEIPNNMSQLSFLRLSNNNLQGSLFPTLSSIRSLEFLLLDSNSLSGNIPASLFTNTSNLYGLDISNNHLVGMLPRGLANGSGLELLLMSNNNFEGSIPSDILQQDSLVALDISHNRLTNSVPSFANSSAKHIHLSNNRLSGLSKNMFRKGSILDTLDLSHNEISSGISHLMQNLRYTNGLRILLLKGNHFTGHIPKQSCCLTDLLILDLSYNNLKGPIPNCLGKINPYISPSMYNRYSFSGVNFQYYAFGLQMMEDIIEFTTKLRSYTYTGEVLSLMSGIDLSSNRLNGNIPFELGNLTNTHALNLSHNNLTGQIPASFSNLTQIESLDLSFNKLNGNIPPQLNRLASLEVFSVAHNNLSGATPERKGQFITFDERSYEGNPFLCGPPLPKSCFDIEQPPHTSSNGGSNFDGHHSLVDMHDFYVSFAVAYMLVLLTIAAVLCINPYWRRAWTYYIELVWNKSYYFIQDNLCC